MSDAGRVRDPEKQREYERTRNTRAGIGLTRRSVTVSLKRPGKNQHLVVVDETFPDRHHERPKTRGECVDGARPCPWLSCHYHLAIEVTERGGMKFLFPGVEIEDMAETCALDVADRGGATLIEVAKILNVTRERVRQTEEMAAEKIKRRDPKLAEFIGDESRATTRKTDEA